MTLYTFFNYTGCFWKHYVELTEINKTNVKYERCVQCDNENQKTCSSFTPAKKLEHILIEIFERSLK